MVKFIIALVSFLSLFLSKTLTVAQNLVVSEQQKIVASDRNTNSFFGAGVSMSERYVIVGAPGEPNVSDNGILYSSGAAYLFEQNASGKWEELQRLTGSGSNGYEYFGQSVSVSGDYAIVGAFGESEGEIEGEIMSLAGAAYIYEKNENGFWEEVQRIVASDRNDFDFYGYQVSISGKYAVVGAFNKSENINEENVKVAAGSAYIYERDEDGIWNEAQKLASSDIDSGDLFGISVSISGDNLIIGASNECEDSMGGDSLFWAGSAYIFERDENGVWVETQKIVSSDREAEDDFGISVAISEDYAVVGARYESEDATGNNTLSESGSAYLFEKDGNDDWKEVQKFVASDRLENDWFGHFVSVSNNNVLIGSQHNSTDFNAMNMLDSSGAAYLYSRDSQGLWSQVQKIVATDRKANDIFGRSVAISNEHLIVGSVANDFDENDLNEVSDAGAVYFLELREEVLDNCDIDITTSSSGSTITANKTNATYQWINCDDNTAISDATGQSFTATMSGSYAVELTENGCMKASECVQITILGVDQLADGVELSVYPNPVADVVHVSFPDHIERLRVSISDINGKQISKKDYTNTSEAELELHGNPGMYFLTIITDKGPKTLRVIKE